MSFFNDIWSLGNSVFAVVGTHLSRQKYGESKEEYDAMRRGDGYIRDNAPEGKISVSAPEDNVLFLTCGPLHF